MGYRVFLNRHSKAVSATGTHLLHFVQENMKTLLFGLGLTLRVLFIGVCCQHQSSVISHQSHQFDAAAIRHVKLQSDAVLVARVSLRTCLYKAAQHGAEFG